MLLLYLITKDSNFLQIFVKRMYSEIYLKVRIIKLGQINLYKIDENKKDEFINKLEDKFERKGRQEHNIVNDKNAYVVSTYVSKQEDRKMPDWKWILDECNYQIPDTLTALKAILVIEQGEDLYAATYGMAYYIVDKYCDTTFAFDFARRIKFKQIKTTTLTSPNSQRNKTVNVYLNYNNFLYNSGEAYAKIKAKIDVEEDFEIHGELVEIGHSIKTRLPIDSIENILYFIKYVEEIRTHEEVQKIPVFYKIKDNDLIKELDNRLSDRIEENIACINISELDIIGVTEVFNHNDTTFILKYKDKSKEYQELTKGNIEDFIKNIKKFDYRNDFLNIKVISNRNGEYVRTDFMKRLIDYTDDEKKCLLIKGEWFEYNDDYISYLKDSIAEIDVIYNPEYDFGKKELLEYQEEKYKTEKSLKKYNGKTESEIEKAIKDKYYPERAFNNVMEEKYQFKNYDRYIDSIGKEKIEQMDLYKDQSMYAVKIGESSAKLSYAVRQSLTAITLYKRKQLPNIRKVDTVVVWILLKRKKHLPEKDGHPDLNELNMLTLKNELDEWKKTVLVMGYKPEVWINYWKE